LKFQATESDARDLRALSGINILQQHADVTPGLARGIHDLHFDQNVDGRDKPGHDDCCTRLAMTPHYAPALAFSMKSGRSAFFQSGIAEIRLALSRISACSCL
jgi:hypothetical protein